MYKHILYATDFSETSGNVSQRATELAALHQAKLSLIHTIEPIPAYGYPGLAELESPIIESAKESMRLLGEQLQVDEKSCYIEFGSVKNQVLKLAIRLQVDLIIVGSHGRHGFSALLGSSASGIVHGANCDVLTIRCADA